MGQGAAEFEVLYRNDPDTIRQNANLPGELVFTLGKLSTHALHMNKTKEALEKAFPGFGTAWTWEDFGLTGSSNPVQDFIGPYLQLTRAEAMKGSEQVVRGFQGQRNQSVDGVGIAPDLTPQHRKVGPAPTPMIVVANEVGTHAPATKPFLRGLGR